MSLQVVVLNESEVIAALDRAGIKPRMVLDKAVRAAAELVRAAAVPNAPGPSISTEKSDESGATSVTYDVGPDREHWYYRFAETGTQAHQVTPGEARALRIDDRFVARVRHPGTAARPFLRPAIDENEQRAADAAGAVIRDALV